MMRRYRKQLLCVAALILCICCVRYYTLTNVDYETLFGGSEKVQTGSHDHAQGNYILYLEPNRLQAVPFPWGEGIYLYSIEEDKTYLLQRTWNPFGYYMNSFSLCDELLFFEESALKGGPSCEIRIKNLRDDTISDVFETGYDYAYRNGALYGVHDHNGGIYSLDVKTGRKEILISNKEYPELDVGYFYLKEDWLIGVINGLKEDTMILQHLKRGNRKQVQLHFNDEPSIVDVVDKNQLIVLFYEKEILTKYDLVNDTVDTIELKTVTHRGGASKNIIYYDDNYGNVIKLDYHIGQQQILVNAEEHLGIDLNEDTVDAQFVEYCKDYIAMDIEYIRPGTFKEWKHERKLLIFKYDGTFVKEKTLRPRG